MKKHNEKTLFRAQGGVCAPKEFYAGATTLQMSNNAPNIGVGENVVVIYSKRYCTAACEFLRGGKRGACGVVNQKHLKMKFARGIFLNSERALWKKSDIPTIERVCFEVGKALQCPDEFVLVSTNGSASLPVSATPLVQGVKTAFARATSEEQSGVEVARVMDKDGEGYTCAYTFDLGNYTYTIGALYSKNASMSCILTTDVDISAQMLRKALATAVKDSFALMPLRELGTHSEMVCIIANGAAGNYAISQEDNDYDKFFVALESVLQAVCRGIAVQNGKRLVEFAVENAKSKQVSRAIAKALSHSISLQKAIFKKRYPFEEILGTICALKEQIDIHSISISVANETEEFIMYRYGKIIPYEPATIERILSGGAVRIALDCAAGNFCSTGYCGI